MTCESRGRAGELTPCNLIRSRDRQVRDSNIGIAGVHLDIGSWRTVHSPEFELPVFGATEPGGDSEGRVEHLAWGIRIAGVADVALANVRLVVEPGSILAPRRKVSSLFVGPYIRLPIRIGPIRFALGYKALVVARGRRRRRVREVERL